MVCMTKLESILEQAKGLSQSELEELMKALHAFTLNGGGEDEDTEAGEAVPRA